MRVYVSVNYGKLRPGQPYKVQGEGIDWLRLKSIYIPKDWTTTTPTRVRVKKSRMTRSLERKVDKYCAD